MPPITELESSREAAAPPPTAVAVAMSGGVDSSTVAAILHDRGQAIVGLTMQLWNQRRLPQLQAATAPPSSIAAARSTTSTTRAASPSIWAFPIT